MRRLYWSVTSKWWECYRSLESRKGFTAIPVYEICSFLNLTFKNGTLFTYPPKAPCKRTQHCWPTTPNIVRCYMLRPFAHPVAHPVACCWMLLRVVVQSLKPVKLFSQQLPTFLLFRDRRSVAQQCWILLHSSSNIVEATHGHYAWFTKIYGLYPSHDALQVPNIVGSCCVR